MLDKGPRCRTPPFPLQFPDPLTDLITIQAAWEEAVGLHLLRRLRLIAATGCVWVGGGLLPVCFTVRPGPPLMMSGDSCGLSEEACFDHQAIWRAKNTYHAALVSGGETDCL